MLRYIIKYIAIFLLILIPLQLLGMVILAIYLPFVPRYKETLPKCLRYFDNHEYYTNQDAHDGYDGLMGDLIYRQARGTLDKDTLSSFKVWWERYLWLALRNPINYYKNKVLGFAWSRTIKIIEHSYVRNNETDAIKATTVVKEMTDGRVYAEYYRQRPYYTGCSKGYRVRVGYKIAELSSNSPGNIVQFTVSFTPWYNFD